MLVTKEEKKKKHSSQTHSAPSWNGEEDLQETLEARGPGFLKNFMNFLKIIFIWQQVTLKNLLSGTPDMEIQ